MTKQKQTMQSKKKTFLMQILGLLVWFAVAWVACTSPSSTTQDLGSASVGISIQGSSGSDIQKVTLTVSGADISSFIVQDLEKAGGQWKGVIDKIPAGSDRTFAAKAYNSSHQVAYQGQVTGVTISKAQSVAVFMLLPPQTAPKPSADSVPAIQSIVASSHTVGPGKKVNLTALATTSHEDTPLTVAWSASGGSFLPGDQLRTTWMAPDSAGSYVVTLTLTDEKKRPSVVSFQLKVQPEQAHDTTGVPVHFNNWPSLSSLTASKLRIQPKESIELTLAVLDYDGDTMDYAWASDCGGGFSSRRAQNPVFTAPENVPNPGICKLSVTATDGRGGRTIGDIAIPIASPTANRVPVVTKVYQSDTEVLKDKSLTFRVTASDPENQRLTFSWSASSGTLGKPTHTETTSEITWTAGQACAGTVTVTVQDTAKETTTHTFIVRCSTWVRALTTQSNGKSASRMHQSVDRHGNIYVSGYFTGTLTMGATVLTSAGQHDLFVLKLDPNGNVLWARRAGSTGEDYNQSIVVDSQGNSYIAGDFHSSSITFGNITLRNTGGRDIYLARLDTDGNWEWARHCRGTSHSDDATGILHIDNQDNIYLTGQTPTHLTCDGGAIVPNDGIHNYDAFLIKYDRNGNVVLAKNYKSPDYQLGWQVATDNEGSIYIGGMYINVATFGEHTLRAAGGRDGFLFKENGIVRWAKNFGGDRGDDQVTALATQGKNIYVGGYFKGKMSLDQFTLTSHSSSTDLFVAKLDTEGKTIWAKSMGGPDNEQACLSMAVDPQQNVYFCGAFSGTASFGSTRLTSAGSLDVAVVSLDASGKFRWAKRAGSTQNESTLSLSLGPLGSLYLTGSYQGAPAEFDGNTISSDGIGVFIWKVLQPK